MLCLCQIYPLLRGSPHKFGGKKSTSLDANVDLGHLLYLSLFTCILLASTCESSPACDPEQIAGEQIVDEGVAVHYLWTVSLPLQWQHLH